MKKFSGRERGGGSERLAGASVGFLGPIGTEGCSRIPIPLSLQAHSDVSTFDNVHTAQNIPEMQGVSSYGTRLFLPSLWKFFSESSLKTPWGSVFPPGSLSLWEPEDTSSHCFQLSYSEQLLKVHFPNSLPVEGAVMSTGTNQTLLASPM